MEKLDADRTVRNGVLAAVVALALAGSLLMVSCESTGVGGTGSSQIQGTVNSFSSGGATFKAVSPGDEPGRTLAGFLDLVVPPAMAAIGGVTVHLAGTDIATSTDANGSFILSGVPGGEYELVFSYGSASASMTLDVADHTLVTISGVDVSGDNVSYASMTVTDVSSGTNNVPGSTTNGTGTVSTNSHSAANSGG